MFPIVETRVLAAAVKQLKVAAPEIARKRKPGQFIVLRIHEEGERIPLTIADADPETGIITLIFQEAGKSTAQLGTLAKGDSIQDLIGPLGIRPISKSLAPLPASAAGSGLRRFIPSPRECATPGTRWSRSSAPARKIS